MTRPQKYTCTKCDYQSSNWFAIDLHWTEAHIAGYAGTEANTRLIEAAPDLLEALEAFVGTQTKKGKDWVVEYDDSIRMGEAAIAKAKGIEVSS